MNDEQYIRMAIDAAKECKPEDTRAHPKVGVVVVQRSSVVTGAYRGELQAGDHAEYTVLERKLPHATLVGAIVYTTLEPCTTRSHPKIPCVERLIERKVGRVCIGMLDPNPAISGKGQQRLRDANITTDLFPTEFMAEVEELNREFVRHHRDPAPRMGGEYHRPTPDISTKRTPPALEPQRITIREKSAAEILGYLKGIMPSYGFDEAVETVYLGRWTQEPGWQATVCDLPGKLPGGLWHCMFKEVGSGTVVTARTVQDVSALRPGDSVTVSGRIRDVRQGYLESVSLEDAIVRGDSVPFP